MEDRIFQGMEYVYAVYRAGSFRQAAEDLFISQPSVSASVKRVEDRLGAPIFDRSVKPLALTECGRQYIASVEQILHLEREMVEYVNDLGTLRRGRLVLGGSTFFSSLIIPGMINRFNQLYPGIQVELVEESTPVLEDMLEKGTVDMIVDHRIPSWEHCEWKVLFMDHLLLAVPKSFRANAGMKEYRIDSRKIRSGEQAIDTVPEVPLERFRDVPFILLKPENDTRRRADEIFEENRFTPSVKLEFDQQLTAYLVSCSGMGACFVGSTIVRRFGANPDMVYYRLGSSKAQRSICLFWRSGRYMTRAMAEFRQVAVSTGL